MSGMIVEKTDLVKRSAAAVSYQSISRMFLTNTILLFFRRILSCETFSVTILIKFGGKRWSNLLIKEE